MTTIDGPDGISASTDKNIPIITEKTPINVATTTINSGELTNLLAVAAGIINIAVISNSPIICNDNATTIVKTEVNSRFIYKGLIPSAFAKSSSTVTNSKDDQLNNIIITAKEHLHTFPKYHYNLQLKCLQIK